jgi:hypothetical protein
VYEAGGLYLVVATKDGNVCDDDGKRPGCNAPAFLVSALGDANEMLTSANTGSIFLWHVRL